MLAFILFNWRWLLPTVAAFGFAIDAGIQHIRVADRDVTIARMEEQKAKDIAAAEQAVRKALQADAENSNRIVADYVAEIETLKGGLQDALVRQAIAEARPECNHTPDSDAFDRSVRPPGGAADNPHPGAPAAPGRAGDGVPAGTGPTGRFP